MIQAQIMLTVDENVTPPVVVAPSVTLPLLEKAPLKVNGPDPLVVNVPPETVMFGDIVTEDPEARVSVDVPPTVTPQLPTMSSGTFTATELDSVIGPLHVTVPVNCTDPAVNPTLLPARLENNPLNVTFPKPDLVSVPLTDTAGPML
jgi:hypothetical protein